MKNAMCWWIGKKNWGEVKYGSIGVSHGFFMHILINIMKKHAFKIDGARVTYSNGEYILAER